MTLSDSDARMALSVLVEPGSPSLRDLLKECAPADAVQRLLSAHSPRAGARETIRQVDLADRLTDMKSRAKAAGLRWVTPGGAEWVSGLEDLSHFEGIGGSAGAPVGLWLRGAGDLGVLSRGSVAVVGARSCTTYGAECASDVAAGITSAGGSVTSGAAFGIDACAHRGALAAEGATIAVLASGADVDSPAGHGALLSRIARTGVILSEQPPGEPAKRHRFLSRNRLIAALSCGTVVIEAAERSGSLNTLHWADQLGRTTMALPGPVTSSASGGTHRAIRDGKAQLVTSAEQVIESLEPARAVAGFRGGTGSRTPGSARSE